MYSLLLVENTDTYLNGWMDWIHQCMTCAYLYSVPGARVDVRQNALRKGLRRALHAAIDTRYALPSQSSASRWFPAGTRATAIDFIPNPIYERGRHLVGEREREREAWTTECDPSREKRPVTASEVDRRAGRRRMAGRDPSGEPRKGERDVSWSLCCSNCDQ